MKIFEHEPTDGKCQKIEKLISQNSNYVRNSLKFQKFITRTPLKRQHSLHRYQTFLNALYSMERSREDRDQPCLAICSTRGWIIEGGRWSKAAADRATRRPKALCTRIPPEVYSALSICPRGSRATRRRRAKTPAT